MSCWNSWMFRSAFFSLITWLSSFNASFSFLEALLFNYDVTNAISIKTPHLDYPPINTPGILFFNLVRHLHLILQYPYWDSAIMMTTLQVNIEHFSYFVTSEDVRTLDAFKRKTSLVDLLQWEPCQPVRRSTFLTSSSRHIFKHASLPGVRYRIYSVASQTRPSHCAQRRIATQHVSF